MPGMSISGVCRLQVLGTALLAGLIAVLAVPAPSWAATAPGTGVARAQLSGSPAVTGPWAPSSSFWVWAGPAAAVGDVDDVDDVGVAGGQPVASTDLSMDLVSAQPAVVPWILVALFILVVAGAVRAYGKSPQRAALRSRRTPR